MSQHVHIGNDLRYEIQQQTIYGFGGGKFHSHLGGFYGFHGGFYGVFTGFSRIVGFSDFLEILYGFTRTTTAAFNLLVEHIEFCMGSGSNAKVC